MNLEDFFKQQTQAALAFSGGTDSSYLLYAGMAAGCRIHAYYVKSAFQPRFELEDAWMLAKNLGAKMTVLTPDLWSEKEILQNPANRCYFCKKLMLGEILKAAKKDGFELLIDGTNASDDGNDRPGMKALSELSVRSPLRECGISKSEVRRLSKEAGLFTWNKPSYACLATRIPAGTEITPKQLQITEAAEDLLSHMGFSDFRIRMCGKDGKLQIREEQFEKLLRSRNEILEKLKPYYESITLDLEGRT